MTAKMNQEPTIQSLLLGLQQSLHIRVVLPSSSELLHSGLSHILVFIVLRACFEDVECVRVEHIPPLIIEVQASCAIRPRFACTLRPQFKPQHASGASSAGLRQLQQELIARELSELYAGHMCDVNEGT